MTTDAMPQTDRAIDRDLFCQGCGYNLRGLTGNLCPECGRSLVGLRLTVSRIPWVHRRVLGRVRAYAETVALVMFRQHDFADEMARPVCYSDAQRFRWVTVALAALPVHVAGLILWAERLTCPTTNEIVMFVWTNPWLGGLFHFAWFLFLAAATGLPSYFFHPKSVPIEQQNRAIALSYYTCGTLSLTLLPVSTLTVMLHDSLDDTILLACLLLSIILPLFQWGIWLSELTRLIRRVLPQHPGRAVGVAILCPLLWPFLLGLCFVVLPAVVLYVGLIMSSLF